MYEPKDWEEGAKVRSIELDQPNGTISDEHSRVVSMTVSNQNGQMAAVPWIRVEWKDGTRDYYNAALLLRVGF